MQVCSRWLKAVRGGKATARQRLGGAAGKSTLFPLGNATGEMIVHVHLNGKPPTGSAWNSLAGRRGNASESRRHGAAGPRHHLVALLHLRLLLLPLHTLLVVIGRQPPDLRYRVFEPAAREMEACSSGTCGLRKHREDADRRGSSGR